MAVVGEAKVIIRAVTDRLRPEIVDAFRGVNRDVENAGREAGERYTQGLTRAIGRGGGVGDTVLNKFFSREYLARAEQARQTLRTFNLATILVTTGIVGLIGSIGSLLGPLTALVAALSQASKTLIVIPAIIASVGQAAITLGAAFRGVGAAISSGLQAQQAAGRSLAAEEQALRRLRDARLALKRLIEEEKPEALAEARQNAADAADRAADALRGAERAERNYFDAQEEVLDATNALNDAREEAKERLQQLRFATEGAAISEKRARIEFEKARESLQRVQDLPPNSRARQEAELAFARADLNLRRAIDRNSDLKKEERTATIAGVEGSDQVVDAKERLANAYQNEQDAAFDAARAFRDAARAQSDAQRAAADAAAGGRVERELDERIARAREAVRDAELALREGAGGVDAYRQALAKLSPEARKFVEYYVDEFIPAIRVLSGAAGRRFFGPLTEGFQLLQARIPQLIPLFEETGGILGELAKGFFEIFFSAENFGRTEKIWKINNGLLDSLGKTVLNLVEGLAELLVAAEPVITAFGDWALQTSTGWLNDLKKDTDGVTSSFEEALRTAGRIFGIFGTLGEGLGFVFDAASGEGNAIDIFLTDLEDKVGSFRDSAKAANEDGSLATYLNKATENGILFLDILGNILGAFGDIADDEGVNQFLTSLNDIVLEFREALPGFTEKDGALAGLGELIFNLGMIFINLNESGAFETFFETLNGILEKINEFLADPNNKAIIDFLAVIAAYGLALGAVYRPIKFIGDAFVGLGQLLLGNIVVQGFMGKGKLAFLGRVFGTVGGGGLAALGSAGGRAALGGAITSGLFAAAGNIPGVQGLLGKAFPGTFGAKLAGVSGNPFKPGALSTTGGKLGAARGLATAASRLPSWAKLLAIPAAAAPFVVPEEQWDKLGGWWDNTVTPWFSSKPSEVEQQTSGTWNFLGDTQPKQEFPKALNWYGGAVDPWLQNRPAAAQDATSGFYNWLGADGELRPQFNAATGTYSSTISPWLSSRPGEANSATAGFYSWAGATAFGPEFASVPLFFNKQVLPFFLQVAVRMQMIGKVMWRGLLGELPSVVQLIAANLNALTRILNPFIALYNTTQALSGRAGRLNYLPNVSVSVPRLAQGGIIMPQSGGMLAILGEGGKRERVEPLDPDGLSKRDKAIIDRLSGGGATINVYPSAGMNEQELAKKVSKELAYQLRRGAV